MSSLLKVFLRLDSFPLLSLSYINSKLETVFVNFYIKSVFLKKLHHAGTVCAHRRARLLVCFDQPVGWNHAVKLRLIKLMRLMCSNDGGYAYLAVLT